MPERSYDDALADLARHPGWQVLEQRMRAHHLAEAHDLARFLVYHPSDIDGLRLARARGFWAGQRWMIRQAKNELAGLTRKQPEPDE